MQGAVTTRLSSAASPIVVVCGEIVPARCLAPSLEPGNALTFVRCPEDARAAIPLCQKHTPSVLIAGQAFVEDQKIPIIAQMSRAPGVFVIAVLKRQERDGDKAAANLVRMGCRGVLPSRLHPRLFTRAVLAVLAGEIWAPRLVLSTMLTELLRTRDENALTARENEILELIRLGRKNSEIAKALFICLETVRWHKRRIYRKVGRPAMRSNGKTSFIERAPTRTLKAGVDGSTQLPSPSPDRRPPMR